MIVVSDTSPVNYLVWIGEIDVLPRLFGAVLLPGAVWRELLHPRAPAPVREWAANLPEWVEVRAPMSPRAFAGRGPGESEAISLARELNAEFVLIDERKGRRAAAAEGPSVSGTLIVLDLAAREGLISLPDALERLKQTSFHLTEQLVSDLLRGQAGERTEPPTP